jgi:hypothetical protein
MVPTHRHIETDWTYHGIADHPTSLTGRILVETSHDGPTSRADVEVLRELRVSPAEYSFGWGYNGNGTSCSAAAILADALALGDPAQAGMTIDSPLNESLCRLREAFCWDMLTVLGTEWRLRRAVVLRWSHGWYLSNAIEVLPAVLRRPYSFVA